MEKKGTNLTNYSISLSGILLSLSLIFLYISSYIEWPFFSSFKLKIDLSLLFLMPLFFNNIRQWYGHMALLIRFILGPIITSNATEIGYLGHFILLFSGLVFIYVLKFFLKIFNPKPKREDFPCNCSWLAQKRKTYHFFEYKEPRTKKWWNDIVCYMCTIITVASILTILNFFLFVPLFYWVFGAIKKVSFIEIIKGQPALTFGISYPLFIWILFFPFNIVSFTITSFFAKIEIEILLKIRNNHNNSYN